MNRKRLLIPGFLCLGLLALSSPIGFFVLAKLHSRSLPSAGWPQDSAIPQARVASEYGKLPLSFEENLGQSDARVKFMARGSSYTVFLTDDESTTFHLSAPLRDAENPRDRSSDSLRATAPEKRAEAVVRFALAGSTRRAPVEGLELQPGKSNYFIGNDPARWQRNVPHYARVKYRGVYPGVDLVYYGHQGQLESDYLVAPGADPSQIGLQIDGARAVKLDSQGDLVLSTAAGDVVLHKPIAYQETASGRQEIATNYVQRSSRLIGLRVARYDTRQPLIIDPSMVYSTYLGGSGKDFANSIAVDSTFNAYVTGFTLSTNFPLKSPLSGEATFLATQGGAQETFVSKLDPGGSTLLYSTYLGGTGSNAQDQGAGIAVNAAGQAFVVGTTGASDFPKAGSPILSNMPNNAGAAFLVQLDATGSTLLYSTYLGGSGHDNGLGLALDPSGIAYVVGTTTSINFPISAITAPFQSTNGVIGAGTTGGTGFLSKIDVTKAGISGLLYSTYLGGSAGEQISAVAVDANGNAYMTGSTASANFPVSISPTAAFQSTIAGQFNAFFAQINTTVGGSSGLIYSSFLGGAGTSTGGGDQGNAIALDGTNNAYIAGTTGSTNFPVTAGAFQTTNKDANANGNGLLGRNAFVARFDTTKSGALSLIYSTYLGGSGSLGDIGLGIVVDSQKQAYVSGHTTSHDFPTTSGAPFTLIQGGPGNAFVTVFNPTGTSPLVFSTYWGGSGREDGSAITLDTASPPNFYLAGATTSPSGSFPVSVSAFQPNFGGNQDAFVTKFSAASGAGGVSVTPATIAFGSQTVNTTSGPQTVTIANGSNSALTINSFPTSGTNPSDFTVSIPTGTTGCPVPPPATNTLASGGSCILNVTFSPTTTAAESATLTIHDTNAGGSLQQTVNLTGSGTASGTPDFTVSVSPATASVAAGTAASFTVTVTSVGGFTGAVGLACAGAPSTCTLTPSSVTPAANATVTSMGNVTTQVRSLAPPLLFHMPPGFPGWLWTLAGVVMAVLAAWSATRRATRKLAFAFGLLALLTLTSCSGPIHGGTAAGNYTVTITGSSGALQHPKNFVLTVQ
ncbi:MAG TPA: SBBP repeat-containing protein [Candidatus Acidoferrum sp.]|nr:SBBP repeat-containing protein [Candidatus Acidoferrum sp.]